MFQLYLTPASIAYLTQFILTLAITLFLLNRLRSRRSRSLFLITAFFAPITVFSGLLVFNASLAPYPRILTVFAENFFLALGLVGLNAFAYNFPQAYPQHKWETRVALGFSLAYFFWEAGFMIFRYVSVFTQGHVFIRPAPVAFSIPIIILFAPIACLRQTLAADPRPVSWLSKLWKPEGKDARGARNFALVFSVMVALGVVNALIFLGLPLAVIHAIISVGVLVMLWLFAINYVNFIPGGVNVAARLSILTLTLFLALLGALGWLIAPPYIATFRPDWRDRQTLRFTPNAAGGYDAAEVDFHFESALGEKADAQTLDKNGNQKAEFAFPFYGKTYGELYANPSGFISLGESFRSLDFQSPSARVPALFPLVVGLAPDPADPDSGLYIRREPERVTVTWYRMASVHPEERYTFQAVLRADGIFEFSYNGLPESIVFAPNGGVPESPLLRGVVAGRGEPWYQPPDGFDESANLLALSRAGAVPLIQNYFLAFRRYLHAFMLPVAWVAVGGSLLILFAVPLLLRATIAAPLETLTAGVRRMGAGEKDVHIPVESEDEIGFLTGAFNKMSGALDDLVNHLEARVADRTRELDSANLSLREEMERREAAQRQILMQNRALAAMEEREQIARDLHDSVNQSIQSVILFAETLVFLLRSEKYREAIEVTERIRQGGQNALKDVRLLLYKSQNSQTGAEMDLLAALEERLNMVERRVGVKADIIQKDGALQNCPAVWRENLYWIAIEALNNALKHAGAKRVTIYVGCAGENFEMSVEDDGAGFDPAQTRRGGFGMKSMRERAKLLGGVLSVASSPQNGTRVQFTAKMEKPE